jgi:hypothetical protein
LSSKGVVPPRSAKYYRRLPELSRRWAANALVHKECERVFAPIASG